MVVGTIRILAGQANTAVALFNMVWVAFDLLIFSVIIKAARYRGFEPAESSSDPQTDPPTDIAAPAREGAT